MDTQESHPTQADYRAQLGQVVRSLRKARGWTQQELADRLRATGSGIDLAQSGIARLELGDRPTTVEELLDLSEVFALPVDEFLPLDAARPTLGVRLSNAQREARDARDRVRTYDAEIEVLTALVEEHGPSAFITRDQERRIKAARRATWGEPS